MAAGRTDTTLLRAAAAILVANSHLELYYPRSWMAGDGLLGNSLFFLLAGYGLAKSGLAKSATASPPDFAPWFLRRLARMYPAMWMVVTVVILLRLDTAPTDLLTAYTWPSPFTFVELVVPFYVLIYPLVRRARLGPFVAALALLCVAYLAFYLPDALRMPAGDRLMLGLRPIPIHAIAYFQVMLLGGVLALSQGPEARSPWGMTALAAAVFAAYVGVKLGMSLGYGSRFYVVLHLVVAGLCWLLFAALCHPRVCALAYAVPGVRPVASFIAGLTFEIYVAHAYIAHSDTFAALPLAFPLFWIATFALSAILGVAARFASGALEGALLGRPVAARPSRGA